MTPWHAAQWYRELSRFLPVLCLVFTHSRSHSAGSKRNYSLLDSRRSKKDSFLGEPFEEDERGVRTDEEQRGQGPGDGGGREGGWTGRAASAALDGWVLPVRGASVQCPDHGAPVISLSLRLPSPWIPIQPFIQACRVSPWNSFF